MFIPLLLSAAVAAAIPTVIESGSSSISVAKSAPDTAGAAVLHPFVSFSIEFASFPDYAGALDLSAEERSIF